MRWLIFLLVLPMVQGAVINGGVYDISLEPVPDSILLVNTTPEQILVLEDGTYSLELKEGNYRLEARLYEDIYLTMRDVQEIKVVNGRDYNIDMILLPVFDINQTIYGDDIDLGEIPDFRLREGVDYSFVIIVLIIMAVVLLLFLRKPKKKKLDIIPNDLDEILRLIKEEGGRINQKELRNRLPYSEAKVSLMVSDLEERGKVKRFKKGRGNIIRLEE
jgi:uncharacterized membrane protein